MRPARIQYFMASHLGKVAGGTGVLLGTACVVINTAIDPATYLPEPSALLGLLLACLCAAGVGFLSSYFILGRILFLIFSRINGPFAAGDIVRILCSRHRDRVTRVYDVWASRGQVRVDLGEDAKRNLTDVLMYHEICRERA